MKLLLSLLLIGFCLFQLSNAAPAEDNSDDWENLVFVSIDGPSEEDIIQDFGEKPKVLINRVKNYFKQKVQSSFESFRKLEHNLSEKIILTDDEFDLKLQSVVTSAKEKIQAKAAELKEDAKECSTASEKTFENLFMEFLFRETYCVTDELTKGIEIVNTVIDDVYVAINDIEDLPNKLITCLEETDKIDCVKKNVWDVAKTQGRVLKDFIKDFSDGTQFVIEFKARLAQCALTQLINAEKSAYSVIANFTECMINKSESNL